MFPLIIYINGITPKRNYTFAKQFNLGQFSSFDSLLITSFIKGEAYLERALVCLTNAEGDRRKLLRGDETAANYHPGVNFLIAFFWRYAMKLGQCYN